MQTDPVKKLSKEFQDFRKGIYHAETLSGVLTKHQKGSSASGMYGIQWGQMKGAKADGYYSDLNKTEFLADTALQSQVLLDRYNDEMPGVRGYKTTAEYLRKEYQPEITEAGGDFNYSDDELAALVHFLGRDGARKYLGYHKRDKKPLDEALPNIYGPNKNIKNMTPTEYLEKYRKGKEGNFRYGGEVEKYQTGGNVITPGDLYQIDANQINSNVLTTTGNYFGPYSDSAAQMGTQIDLDAIGATSAQEQVGEQAGSSTLGKVADVAAVAMTGMEMVSDYSSGVRGYKDFYKDNPDNVAYDRKSQTAMLKEARAQKYGAAAEGVGFALGTILTGGNVAAGRLVGNIAEFGAEAFSKLFGVGRKAKRHMEKQQFDNMTYVQGEESKASYEAYKEKQAKQISEYISGLTDTGKIAYAELGGMLYGPSHAEGGIPIEVEGGEFIVKKSAIDDNKVKTITGTNKQIASKINADAGGKNPFPGAKMNMYG